VNTIQSVCGRASAHSVRTILFTLGCLAFAGPLLSQQPAAAAKSGGDPNKLYLQGERSLGVSYSGSPAAVQALASGQLKALTLASGDLDGDGVEDLLAGYASANGGFLVIHRGNLDAFAPQSQASWQAIGEGRFPSPFLPQANVIELPEAPDFLAVGNFTGDGHLDVVAGARGSQILYILANDGKGGLLAPRPIALSGALTALGTTHFDAGTAYSHIVAGTSGQGASQLTVFEGTLGGVNVVATAALRAPPTSLSFGSLGGDSFPDIAVVAGGQLQIVHGRDVHAARIGEGPAILQAESVSIPFAATSVTLGSFIQDRASRLQMAVLGTDGSVHIVTRAGLDTRPWSLAQLQSRRRALRNHQPDPLAIPVDPAEGWQVAESFPGVVSVANPNQPPILFRTRISSRGSDDVMALDSTLAQVHVLSHESVRASATGTSSMPTSFHSTLPMSASHTTVAGIPMRVNIDGRPGVVVLKQGQLAPQVMMPLPDPTFFPNRFDDIAPRSTATTCLNTAGVDGSGDCTLREAILKANATAGTDTVMVAAGTYTLSQPKVLNDYSGQHGALYVNDSLNIVGAGQNTTIIQAGTLGDSSGTPNGVDMVMAVNEDINPFTDATASISSVTLQNGHNRGTNGNDGDGGCMEFDTGSSGTANLTLTSVTLNNCDTTQGDGAGLVIFNFTNPGAGFATISNSIIQNNSAVNTAGVAADGGGIWVESAQMVMTNSQVINNKATQVNGASFGVGGGLYISGPSASGRTAIHASTISGNHSASDGGGVWTTQGVLIDQGTLISNNVAAGQGGGIWANIAPETLNLSKVTITGNSATGNGGGINVDDAGGAVNIQFSRLAGNATGGLGSNLHNQHDPNADPGTVVTAQNNWWGTNSPSNTIDSAGAICPAGPRQVCFDPFIVLTNTASPNKIRINQSSALTADMSNDNNGSGAALAGNLNVIVGLPVTFNNAILGTIPQAQPETMNASAQATATFNAGGVGGNGSADATVDQQTVTAGIVILQPPSITKSFNPTTVAVNAPSTVTFGITNGNTVAINSSFADALPANLVVATTPSVVNSCGGTVTATAGTATISFTNAALPVGTCSITVNVQGTTDGVFNNSVTINSTDAGNGNTASASLTVINAPTIVKAFGAAAIPLNGATSLSFTVTNPNANLTVNGMAFTDNLPAGVVVATPSNLTTNCGGAITATAGSSSIAQVSSNIGPSASCTVSVNITGTTPGVKNNSVQVTSTNGGTGNTSNASITVAAPPVIIKAFGAASIPLNGSTSLSFTIQNNNTTQSLSGVGFTDTLPAGLVIATPSGQAGTCGAGTIVATSGTNVISLTGAAIAVSSSCSFSVNVTGTSAGQKNNTTANVTSTEGGTGGTASASITVVAAPVIAKAFNPTTIPVNGTTTLTFTVTNPAANTVAETGVAFTDTLPAGLVVSTPNGLSSTCNGTATAVAGATSISLTGGSIAVNTSCTVVVNVAGIVSGQYTNTSGSVSSTNGGTGNTASANLTVASPPTITKAFGAATLPLNGATSLTFHISNPNAGVALTGVAFTDNLPAGLVVATPNSLSSTCGGTATAVPGPGVGSASLSGGTLAASASCTVSLNVQGTTAGVKNNSVQVTSTEGGTGNTSNASITVAAPPVIIKAFGAASIPLNGSTSLSFTIQNNNTTQSLSGVGFSDTLPAGLVIASPNGQVGTCGAGTIVATSGTNVISLTGAALAVSSSCTFSVNVTGAAAGQQNNTTGNVTSTEGGTGGTASASIAVVTPLSIAKVFGAAAIPLNGTTSLTVTVTNPAANTVAETGVAFTDTLPIGIVVATPNGLTNTCGGVATAVAGSGTISLAGGTVGVNTNCAVHVNVTGAASGNFTNTTGAVTSTNGGTGNTASANLTVATPPTITKAFGAARVPLNGTSSLTFNITNPNTNVPLSGVAFTDNLPAGLVISTPNGLAGTCGAGTITATAGSGAVSLSGGTLTSSPAAGSTCTFAVNVTGATAGVKNNSVQITSTEGGTGNTSNASITVAAPPVIIKAFGAASVPLNGSTSLSFTIQNNNATQSLSGVGFSDTLPAGLVIATPNGQVGTCGAGTIVATSGTNAISLAGAALAVSSSCTFSVNVTGTAAGTQNNTTGAVTSTEGGTGGTASASLAVVAPPSIAKAFNPTAVALNATTSLTFTITNPAANAVAETGVAFSDTFPAGIVVATPNGLTNTCGGTATAVAGSASVSLTGGTVAASSNCTLTVNATGSVSGNFTNTSGAVSSTNGGTGNTATANVTVASPPVITKSFGAATLALNGSTSLSFTISNPVANAVALTGVAFTDSLPAGLVVATSNALAGSCGGGTITATAGSSSVILAGATLATSSSCTFSVSVTAVTGGVKNNSVQVISANGGTGNTSNASVTATSAPVIVKAFGAASIPLNGSTSLSFTIQNNNATQSLSGVGFTDTLPSGLTISTPNGLAGTCGAGTITGTQGTGTISLTGATLAASSSCTFAVNVTGIAAGTQNNTTGNVTSTEGAAGGTASASIVVVAPPSIVKAFNSTAISPNGTSTLSFTITNPTANTAALTGVSFTDTLPAGITVATPNGLAGACGGGTITAAAASGAVNLSGATIAAGTTCTFSVGVTGANPGVFTNTTGVVSSTNGGTGGTATANLTIATPPSITKAFGAASIGLAGSTSLTFTITNPNASIALTGIAFTDALPAGLVVSTPNGLAGTCGSGTVTATGGSTSVTLAGGTIATSGTCSFAVNITAVTAGNLVNTTGTVSATNGGTGNTATASINVAAPDLTITKSHASNFFQGQTAATYTITVNNIGPGPTAGTVTATDTLPAGLTATAMAGTGWTCTVATLACTRTDALAPGASYPAITLTVSVAANAAASVTNIATVAGGGEINTANDTAMDVTTITLPPDFTLAVTPGLITIRAGQPAQYGITVTPINNAFPNAIDFSVTGLPGTTSFVFTSPSVTPGLNPATSTLKILTTPGDPFLAQNTERTRLPLYAMFLPFAGLVLSGIGFRKRKLTRKWVLVVAIFVCSGLTFYGCASAGNFQKLGTPPGTYTVIVTATSGNLQHSAPVTLVVTP
jgi:uncharacterized repeat protein (TIGR01451 family)